MPMVVLKLLLKLHVLYLYLPSIFPIKSTEDTDVFMRRVWIMNIPALLN